MVRAGEAWCTRSIARWFSVISGSTARNAVTYSATVGRRISRKSVATAPPSAAPRSGDCSSGRPDSGMLRSSVVLGLLHQLGLEGFELLVRQFACIMEIAELGELADEVAGCG